jgi:predicted nucleic acid-binding protein
VTHCTSDNIFTLDTNIRVYSIDRAAGPRHEIARQIVNRAALGACCLTLQSVSEFFSVVTRKGVVPPVEAVPVAEAIMELFRTATATASAVRAAMRLAASGRASYWDALLVHTAAEAECTAILTEDLADNTSIAGVRIVNPFDGAALSAAAEAILSID